MKNWYSIGDIKNNTSYWTEGWKQQKLPAKPAGVAEEEIMHTDHYHKKMM